MTSHNLERPIVPVADKEQVLEVGKVVSWGFKESMVKNHDKGGVAESKVDLSCSLDGGSLAKY